MAYIDDHGGKDSQETLDKNHGYTETEIVEEESSTSTETDAKDSKNKGKKQTVETTGEATGGNKGGILSRMRRALFGDETLGDKTKRGFLSWRTSGGDGGVAKKLLAKVASPKAIAALALSGGIGVFSILGIFTSYKNDGVVKNDPPLGCEQGVIELPAAGEGDDEDIQATVDVLYDLFCEELGLDPEALKGIVACMHVESRVWPDRLESDFILTAEKEAFDAVAGPGTAPDSATAKEAYWAYGEAFQSGGGWNGNANGYILDGHMCCGIGLIQWTKGRGVKLLDGLDVVNMDVSPMDIQYQAAFLLAEMKSDAYSRCSPDGGDLWSCTDAESACEIFFTTMVSGGLGGDLLQERKDRIPEIETYVEHAAANSEYRADILTMAELLADDSFTSSIAQSNKIQLCVNHTYISTADIANAAVSISFLERGEYEDVHGAYGMYRRAARSPVMINDWNYVEGIDGVPNNRTQGVIKDGTYGSKFSLPDDDPRKNSTYYTNEGSPGKLDLIACTEYYYFAHMIAFPKEAGTAGNAGYFSSCDRGTATAVRIAGADDKFPAGNPLAQLQWAAGGKKIGSQHNPDRRGPQDAGFLWQFAGFLRGCDLYSASGSASISPGTVMISWNVKAANGMLKEAMMGGATAGAVGDEGGVVPDGTDPVNDQEIEDGFDEDAEMTKANLRWPLAVTNTTRHIITFVGQGTVQKFWGMEWLYQQWTLFDDTDSLIRGDLTVEVPGIMKAGLAFKGKTAKAATDQKATFYEQEMEGARTIEDVKAAGFTEREMSFNAKTGLPTFHSWEQIFVRLVHNSDDDVAAKKNAGEGSGKFNLYNEFSVDKDNYLDDAEDPDRIEQYQAWNTNSDKWFFEDWNSIGEGDPAEAESKVAGEDDYKGMTAAELTYGDDGTDKWTKYAETGGVGTNPFWRYELITDIEYRANQLLRFGMASFMCSLPSEEDADIYQSGAEGNDTGHIIGNLYRRYSRIPNETDTSGRYFYYNTVVSNDMLQDLVQLWSHERNGQPEEASTDQGGGDYTARHFGPMYLFGRVGAGMDGYDVQMRSKNYTFLDRRYGLTASDVQNIMDGLCGLSMGAGADAVNEKLGQMLATPMHKLSDAQIALYAKERNSDSTAYTDGRGAHESDHEYSEEEWYEDDIYGVNPFLMLESEKNLGRVSGSYLQMNPKQSDWSASGGNVASLRKDLDTEVRDGVDGASDKEDPRLAWIDRHWVYGKNGSINMLAYQVAGLNPSLGVLTAKSAYESSLKTATTLDATETGPNATDTTFSKYLYGSWGRVRYTDFIYGEDTENNQKMAKRLFGTDHRQDGETYTDVRDDYNRREYIVIPYYHTHAQMCDHSHLADFDHYILPCKWWDNDPECTNPDVKMIDTQTWLNTTYNVNTDYGDTISFSGEGSVSNRGKYNLEQLIASANSNVRYFTDRGMEIYQTDKPYIHVTCGGWQQSVGCGCLVCTCTEATCPNRVRCHACHEWVWCKGPHDHSCTECLNMGPGLGCHDHTECDSALNTNLAGIDCHGCDPTPGGCPVGIKHHQDGGTKGQRHYTFHMSGTTDDCHDQFGCNALEFFYHNPGEYSKVCRNIGGNEYEIVGSNVPVNAIYMVIQVVKEPIEDFDINNWKDGTYVVPDKANLLQQVYYESQTGFVDYNWEDMVNGNEGSLTNPKTDDGSYVSPHIHHILGDNIRWSEEVGKVTMPIGNDGTYGHDRGNSPSIGNPGLFGIFTIEGNLIREKLNEDCETVSTNDENCVVEDFQRLESIRNRVGYGKGLGQKVNGSTVTVSQNYNPAMWPSRLDKLDFDSSTYGENGVDPNYGYGETLITGAQHGFDPTPTQGAYGTEEMGAGPDGSKGNKNAPFGNSLFREILGDEHVQHVRFGSQNLEHLQDKDIDNGRDFMYYVNESRWEEHLKAHFGDDKSAYEEYMDPSFYQKPDTPCPCGCGKIIVPSDLSSGTDWLAYPSNENSAGINDDTGKPTGVGGVFRDLDEDRLYLDPYNNIPTDKPFYDVYKRKVTDEPKNDLDEPNQKNKKLLPTGENIIASDPTAQRGQLTNDGGTPISDGAMNSGAAGDGDYNLWVTHASRGTRGMMTQYLNFKGFFHDASSGTKDEKAFMYMLFTVIKRTGKDEATTDHITKNDAPVTGDPALKTSGLKGHSDGDIDLKEDFSYDDPPGDSIDSNPRRVWGTGSVEIKNDDGEVIGYKPVNFTDTYGQGNNSHWKNLIDIYNAAMSDTRVGY